MEGANGRLCAMEPQLRLKRFPPSPGIRSRTINLEGQCLTVHCATAASAVKKNLWSKVHNYDI